MVSPFNRDAWGVKRQEFISCTHRLLMAILVLNFGGQFCHLIARRIRELGVKSEIIPYDTPADQIKSQKPDGIILSGGPSSVYDKDSPHPDHRIYSLGTPILGICYGMQLQAHELGGKVEPGKTREFGRQEIRITDEKCELFEGTKPEQTVWFSHGDRVTKMPAGYKESATSADGILAGMYDAKRRFYAIQFHPEVAHTENGMAFLSNFVFKVCKAKKDYDPKLRAQSLISFYKKELGQNKVLMAVSGGVDSFVAATLLHKAIGSNLYLIFVDHGLLRQDEAAQVEESLKAIGFDPKNYELVNASKQFLSKLKGVSDPEEKRKIIGHEFIAVFEEHALKIGKKVGITYLAQGTIYPDRVESAGISSKATDKIKSHHNLTLPEKMNLKVIEPLAEFYKDEVREIGKSLGVPAAVLGRHPFPGPGLAVRILGEIDSEKLELLRKADAIYMEELKDSGYYDKVWQAFAALLPVKAVGVKGDSRTYEYIISIRAVNSVDGMTADWSKLPHWLLEKISNRMMNEVRGIGRVVYDISQKPPATIEYE
jgi:GMP synthase (glutamine-hydrolysing)